MNSARIGNRSFALIFVCVCVFAMFPPGAPASESGWMLQNLGGGALGKAVANGRYVYIGAGSTIDVFDLGDPSRPELVDRVRAMPTPKPISDGAIVGNALYVAWGSGGDVPGGISIFSLVDPAHPVFATELDDLPSDALAVSDGYVYLASGQFGTTVLDARDPFAPIVIGGADPLLIPVVQRIAIAGTKVVEIGPDWLFEPYLAVYDISDPSHPLLAGDFTEYRDVILRDFAVEGEFAVGVGSSLVVLDLGDPANIAEVFTTTKTSLAQRVLVDREALYVFTDDVLQVWDNTTPSQPSLIDTTTIDTTFTDQVVLTSSGPLDFTDHDIALAIDDSIIDAPTLRSRFTVPVGVDVEAAAIDGDDLFLAEGAYGFMIVDSASFGTVAHFEAAVSQGALYATDLEVSGNRAVLVSAYALIVADVSDRQNPVESGRVAIDAANRVVTRGNNAYVTSEVFGELSIFDIADAGNVRKLGVLSGVYPNDLVVRGNYAYMAAAGDLGGDGGLRIADVSDENSPTLVGSDFGCGPLEGMAVALSADGATTYVGCEDGSMRILDTHDVASPAVLGTYVLPDDFNSCLSIALRNGRVYIGHAYGVDEVDVADPGKPIFIDRLPTHWQVNRVYAPEDGSVFAITGFGGIYRFDGETIFANGFE